MEVYTIDLALKLMLRHVVLTHMTTHSFESMDSSIVKLLHINALVWDFETPLKG